MPRFTLTPLAFALFCLCSGPALAGRKDAIVPATGSAPQPGAGQDASQPAAPGSSAPAQPVASTQTAVDAPIDIEADQISGNASTVIDATGDARLHQADTTVTGAHLKYQAGTQEVENFAGPICVEEPKLRVIAPKARFNLGTKSGVINDPEYFLRGRPGHGQALLALIKDPQHAVFDQATYTTCHPGTDDWFFKFRKLEINRATDTGVARDATLVFKGQTLFYLPWFDFPLDNQRRSGVLPPSLSTSTNNGLDLRVPYYWNIAPNQDATFYPRMIQKRGVQLGVQYRYLEPTFSGQTRIEYLPGDHAAHRDRWNIDVQHSQNLSTFLPGLGGSLNFQRVSDYAYFRDLSSQLTSTSLTTLPEEGVLNWSDDNWNASASVLDYQTLQDPNAPITPPYNRRQVLLTGHQPVGSGPDVGLIAEADDFTQTSQVSGLRTTLYPSVSLPLTNRWGYVTPKVGLNSTTYALDPSTLAGTSYQQHYTRTLPIMSLDSGVKLERNVNWLGQSYLQTLEPRAYYLYIPYRDQDQLPVFDSATSDFDFPQMFTENRYSSWDRIGDANSVTTAVTSRLIDPATGIERLHAGLGQRFNFQQERVLLNTPQTDSRSSDVIGTLGGRFNDRWSGDTFLQYSPEGHYAERFNTMISYSPRQGQIFNAGYRYTRGDIDQITLSTQWPINHRYNLLGQWNYELRDKKFLEGIAGLEYNGGCWKLRTVWHHMVTTSTTASNSFFIQLELGGISHVGTNPLELLKQDINGFSLKPANFQEPSTSESN